MNNSTDYRQYKQHVCDSVLDHAAASYIIIIRTSAHIKKIHKLSSGVATYPYGSIISNTSFTVASCITETLNNYTVPLVSSLHQAAIPPPLPPIHIVSLSFPSHLSRPSDGVSHKTRQVGIVTSPPSACLFPSSLSKIN